ncbi:MAG: hypothetical protein IT181_18160, partial [Acidobacteria bacterium]|nr:hypothetical protein [Acidobacteriota bacterium]
MTTPPPVPASRWTDLVLDAARRRGDPEADAVIAALFAAGGPDAVRGVMA